MRNPADVLLCHWLDAGASCGCDALGLVASSSFFYLHDGCGCIDDYFLGHDTTVLTLTLGVSLDIQKSYNSSFINIHFERQQEAI